ncbi:MAG TPA: hypothetical protein VFY78_01600, partial [Gammaproteobacteria bacterium]|nr:hypothetical protein [Gammaproteobacteria bacterium]
PLCIHWPAVISTALAQPMRTLYGFPVFGQGSASPNDHSKRRLKDLTGKNYTRRAHLLRHVLKNRLVLFGTCG